MAYKFYLFDFDYTLANAETGIVKCFKLLMQQEGYFISPDDEIKKTIGLPMIEAIRVLFKEDDDKLLHELKDKYTEFADIHMTPNTVLYQQTIPALRRIKESGAKTAIISSKTRRRIMQTLTRDNIADLVEFVIGSEDVKTHKPSPEGMFMAIERFGADKKDVLYIGDNVIDGEAAQNAGVDFAAVLTGNNVREDFFHLPHVKIMNTLAELP
ncbi:HAD family hydrolase [Megamonas hypermegale]|uniref:HAD family hydrolase n=1 Tax=Megamonas hypermegale TaxID=158847 RepID=UPI0025A4BFC7|nr:HAD family hydrolase [Megamonas hypermegale]MDM8142609.1 HAD family hydrolase [Megamonas hypermegale]